MKSGLLTPPNYQVLLPLSEVKTWLVVDHSDEDSLIASLISLAFSRAEKVGRISIAPCTRYALFPKGKITHFLPYGPVTSVDSSTPLGGSLSQETLWEYSEATDSEVRVEYSCGMTTDQFNTTESGLKIAILRLISYWYDDRDAGSVGKYSVPSDIQSVFHSYWTSPSYYH